MHCPTRPRIVQYMKYRFRKFPFQQQIVGERARFLQILDDQVLCKTLEIKTGQRGQPKSGGRQILPHESVRHAHLLPKGFLLEDKGI